MTREWVNKVYQQLSPSTLKPLAVPAKYQKSTHPFDRKVAVGYIGRFRVRQTGDLKVGGRARLTKSTDPNLAGTATAGKRGYRVLQIGEPFNDNTPTAYILIR